MSFFRDMLRNRERQQLEERLRHSPTTSDFLGLIQIFQEEGDVAKARQLARRGAAAFPSDAQLAAIEKDLAQGQREAECRRLREQIENYPNARLYTQLAEIYRAGGDNERAREVVRAGLHSFPNHGGLRDLHERLSGGAESAAASTATTSADSATSAPRTAPGKARATSQTPLAIAIEGLVGQEGIEAAVLADGAGLPLAAALPDGVDEKMAAAAAADFRKAASPACGEVGLGAFEEAVAETSAGSIYLYTIHDLTLLLFTGPKSRPGLINLRARAFAGKVFGRA